MDFPQDLENRMRDATVDFVAHLAEKMPEGEKIAKAVRKLSTQAAFYAAFEEAMKRAYQRYIAEYMAIDEDLVDAIISDSQIWHSLNLQQALLLMIKRPGSWLVHEREAVIQHFADILPKRVNRERVDRAVSYFLRCILEELWTLPGVSEIREIYILQFQKIEAEAAQKQVALLESQLQATTQLSTDVREGLLQLATALEQHLLIAPRPLLAQPRPHPYHNLFQPDYIRFIGRENERNWLRHRLSPQDRVWQMVITGIGGVGKSALALAIAHEFREGYHELLAEERFEAIIWITAKEEILTIKGRKSSSPSGLIVRTLEDIYTTIAQTLDREDITRAVPGEQDYLVQKALRTQRTLLIVDNMESVFDERVSTFLRNLPAPTKCIITSRTWVDVADVLKLTGLLPQEAEKLINAEAGTRNVMLSSEQRQQLYKRTSGLPLPIKLSMARMASGETFEQIMRWLGNATGDLPDYCVKGQIDIVRQFDLHAWRLLLACSLFDQDAGVSREALGQVADISLADRDDGLTLLQTLSLLNCDEKDRFWISAMVKAYAGTELVNANLTKTLTERWLAWLLEFVQKYGFELRSHVEWSQVFSAEYLHLLSAIRWCREHALWETLVHLAKGTFFYPYLIESFSDLQEILESAIYASEIVENEKSKGMFICKLGDMYWAQGQYEKALERLEQARMILTRCNDEVELGWIAELHADILCNQGKPLEAEQLAKTMLDIGERLNNLETKGWATYRLSKIALTQQQFDEALEWLDKGEGWFSELNHLRGLTWIMYRRGTTLRQMGNSMAAESCLIQALGMGTTWKETSLLVHAKYDLALIYVDTNRLQLAYQTAEEAYDLFERLGLSRQAVQTKEFLQKLSKNGFSYHW